MKLSFNYTRKTYILLVWGLTPLIILSNWNCKKKKSKLFPENFDSGSKNNFLKSSSKNTLFKNDTGNNPTKSIDRLPTLDKVTYDLSEYQNGIELILKCTITSSGNKNIIENGFILAMQGTELPVLTGGETVSYGPEIELTIPTLDGTTTRKKVNTIKSLLKPTKPIEGTSGVINFTSSFYLPGTYKIQAYAKNADGLVGYSEEATINIGK